MSEFNLEEVPAPHSYDVVIAGKLSHLVHPLMRFSDGMEEPLQCVHTQRLLIQKVRADLTLLETLLELKSGFGNDSSSIRLTVLDLCRSMTAEEVATGNNGGPLLEIHVLIV